MLSTLFWFIAGLTLLIVGAEFLVRGASRLALRLGVSPLIVGLTIVAYGTSTPELIVSTKGVLQGQTGIALGNVVGSNVFNILFILGASALIAPLVVHRQMIWQEVPIMIGASVLALVFGIDGRISPFEGFFFLALLGAYTWLQVQAGLHQKGSDAQPSAEAAKTNVSMAVASLALGLVALIFGARWLLDSSVSIARTLGVSELVIGLTIVSIGTSLPEVATSIMASLRGERDIAVGNVVGSNIFNIFGVLGLSAAVSGDGLEVASAALRLDMPIMLAAAFACLPIFLTGHKIARWEGGVFLMYYAAYTLFLILDARGHDAVPLISRAMLSFAMPITILTLVIAFQRHMKATPYAQARGGPGLHDAEADGGSIPDDETRS